MYVKSVMAGEYTAPPAQGPRTAEICGITPETCVLRRKISAYPPRLTTPSCMRAPPESLSPMIGAPTFRAISMTLHIFSACASDREPPKTVKSWLKTKTRLPPILPVPVTTPSPRYFCLSSPKSTLRCSTRASISSKLFGSRSPSSLSRAVSLPLRCCSSIRSVPPPSLADSFNCRRRRSLSCSRSFPISIPLVLLPGRPFDHGAPDQLPGLIHDDRLPRGDSPLRLIEDEPDSPSPERNHGCR